MTDWEQAQQWEEAWWGDCADTFREEEKQLHYMDAMGITSDYGTKLLHPMFDFGNKTVADFGGGPVSILLKSNAKHKIVVEPMRMPDWVIARYAATNIRIIKAKGEDARLKRTADIGLIYNVLLHVEDPKKFADNVLAQCKEVYVFEWIYTTPSPGHPQSFTPDSLNALFKGQGTAGLVTGGNNRPGWAWYGKFKGDK